MKIGIGTCKDSSLVPIYGPCGVDNYLVVSITIVHGAFKDRKLFCPTPTTRYCGWNGGFWALKDVSLNDESDVMMLDQSNLTMCVVNNIAKK